MKALKGLTLLSLIKSVSGYDNSSSTSQYIDLVAGKPINAFLSVNELALGDYFYLALVFGPYVGLYLKQKDMNVPTIWLTVILVTYGGLFATGMIPTQVFYLTSGFWVMNVLLKLLSPKYSN